MRSGWWVGRCCNGPGVLLSFDRVARCLGRSSCRHIGLRQPSPNNSPWPQVDRERHGRSHVSRGGITSAITTTPHLSNASQIPRTEGACMLTLITPFQTISVLTATAHRKPDRIGQSTISTTSNASEPPQRSIRHSSSRNGPPKLSPVATTIHTFAKDNGRACLIAGYRPWYPWTSSIWLATMAASKRLSEDWGYRSLKRSRCTRRDHSKAKRLKVAGRG